MARLLNPPKKNHPPVSPSRQQDRAADSAASPAPYLAPCRPRLTYRQGLLLAALFCFAIFLRLYNLSWPDKPTGDEYHYPWVGLSLLHGEPPTAWSYLKAYDELKLHKGRILHKTWTLFPVAPAFDHPPLYSLLSGAFAVVTGSAKPITYPLERYNKDNLFGPPTRDYVGNMRIWDLNFTRLRWLSAILFAWSFFMLFGIAFRAYTYNVAFGSCLFFSCISHMIIHQRVVVTETLLVPLLLTNIYVMQSYLDGKISARRFAIWTVILTASAA